MIRQTFVCFLAVIVLNVVINAIRINDNCVIKSVADGQQPGMPGGKWVVNLTKFNDYDEVARLAQVAIKDMDAKSTDDHAEHFLIRVKESARSVVAGMMHEIVFYFGECKPGTKTHTNEPLAIAREPTTDGTDHAWIVRPVCQEKPDGKYGICWAQVFEQIWTNTTELSEIHNPYVCKNVPKAEATTV